MPSGPPRIGQAYIEIADQLRKWRDIFSVSTGRRRIMEFNLLKEGTSFADSTPVFTGEVVDIVFLPAKIGITLQDSLFAWLDEPFPALAVPALYPDLAPQDVGGFIPIIFGSVRSVDLSPTVANGVIPLPHIGMVNTDDLSPSQRVDRWAVACHPVFEVVAVYRRETSQINQDVGADEWVIVDPDEYTISETEFTAEENPFGFGAFSVTNLDFIEQQPNGTEIRADVDGIERRGEWGPLAAVGGSPPELLRNAIDSFINGTYTIMAKAGASVDACDTDEIGALREEFEIGFGSPPVIPYCDGAITQSMTAREWLGQFLPDFNLDMFVNRRGKITLRFIAEEDPDRPVFKEGKHIIEESFIEQQPEYIANQTQIRYFYNNATQQFENPVDTIIDNTTEQQILELNSVQKIETEVLDMHFVRDEDTAILIQSYRNDFLSLGSFRQEFKMPAPPTLANVEMAKLVGVTHSMGLQAPSGYTNAEVKITRVVFDFDKLEYTINSILRIPVQLAPTSNVHSGGRPEFYEIYNDPGHVNPIRSQGFEPEKAVDDDAAIGLSLTYASVDLRHATSVAQYVHLHLWGFPEPIPGFVSATVFIMVSYQAAAGTFFPSIDVSLFRPYTTAAYGEGAWTAARQAFMTIAHDCSTDLPLTMFWVTFTAAEFASKFPVGASDIDLRAELYQGVFQDFASPYCILNIWDCWIEYTYA